MLYPKFMQTLNSGKYLAPSKPQLEDHEVAFQGLHIRVVGADGEGLAEWILVFSGGFLG